MAFFFATFCSKWDLWMWQYKLYVFETVLYIHLNMKTNYFLDVIWIIDNIYPDLKGSKVIFTGGLPAILKVIAGLWLIVLKVCHLCCQYHHYDYGGLLYMQVSYSGYYLNLLGWWCRFDSCSRNLIFLDKLLQHWRFSWGADLVNFFIVPHSVMEIGYRFSAVSFMTQKWRMSPKGSRM